MIKESFDRQKFRKFFGQESESISGNVIISPFFSTKIFKEKMERTINFKGIFYHGISGLYKGEKVSYINTGIGQERVADCVLSLSFQKKRKVIFLGAVGAVQDLELGDCVCIERAFFDWEYYRAFGFNHNYQEMVFRPDRVMADILFKTAKNRGIDLKKISAISLHSLWDQNKNLIQRIKAKKIQSVELECALFYAAAEKTKIKSIALAYVSDLIPARPFWLDFSHPEQKKMQKSINSLSEIALEAALF